MSRGVLPVDPGLIERFRAAGHKIAWRNVETSTPGRARGRARIAHLNEEEARVESWGRAPRGGMEVDSGPLGALLLLLESDRRGTLPVVESREAGVDAAFPQGALRATWGIARGDSSGPTVRDLVDLARFALP